MKKIFFCLFIFTFSSCQSGFLKYNDVKSIFKNEEFERKVLIKEVPPEPKQEPEAGVVSGQAATNTEMNSATGAQLKSEVASEIKSETKPYAKSETASQVKSATQFQGDTVTASGGSASQSGVPKAQGKISSQSEGLSSAQITSQIKSGGSAAQADGSSSVKVTESKSQKTSGAKGSVAGSKGVTEAKKSTKASVSAQKVETKIEKRQPELEDSEGFVNRRPLVDPFRVGEKVVHTVSYFGTTAGILTFSIGPYLEVNSRKSYNFQVGIKSSRLFSSFYSVDDKVETYVDYENLVPHVFKLDIKESGQLKQSQAFFDQKTLKADYWENKYTEKNGHEEKKLSWDILPFSQNAFSAIFYMRVFKWNVGQEYTFRVSDDEKNIVFRGKALEKVLLQTDAGKFNAIKIRAEIVSRGALTQTGDLFLWLSDDSHRYVLRIEAKIKIGTLVSEITSLDPG